MITPTTSRAHRLPKRLCAIITGVFLFFVNATVFAQPAAYLGPFAGTGVSGYYAGDNNDAITAKFASPRGVVVDANGNLLVSDANNYVIRKIGTDGKVSVVAGVPLARGGSSPFPSGPALSTAMYGPGANVGISGNGDIYFSADGHSVGKVSGGVLSYFEPISMYGPNTYLSLHYALKVRGNFLYLAHQGSISVVDLTTQKQIRVINVTPGVNIRCMALDASGNIFCTNEAGQLSRVDGTTYTTTIIKAAYSDWQLYVLTSDMAVDNDGNVYLATDNNYILRFAAGTYAKGTVYGETNGRYANIGVDANGTLYMPDRSQSKIMRIQYLDQNTNLTSLGISAGTLSPAFSIYNSSYNITLPNNVDKINITPVIEAATTTMQVKINSEAYTSLASGATSADMNLNVGTNYINILLKPQHPSYSRTVYLTVVRSGIPPPTPANLTVTPGRNNVKLTWDASAGATKYYVYRGTTAANLTLLTGTPVTATTYTDNITVGNTYFYAVTALEVTNAESPKTAVVSGKANTPPVVSTLSASGTPWEGSTLSADYTYTDVDGGTNVCTYNWYRYPDAVSNTGRVIISGASQQTYTLTDADVGKYISVRVVANDGITTGLAVESARVLVTIGTLPVKLVSFQSKIVNGTVQLDWKTATEINSHYFSIERSTDARVWETIGRVNAAGNSEMPVSYSYTDKTPLTGNSYYRLKTVDRDGTSETSSTVQVNLSASSSAITVYPIPSFNTITVKGGERNGETPYLISDAEGKTVRRGTLTSPVQDIGIPELKKGIYFLKVGSHAAVRFIKQ